MRQMFIRILPPADLEQKLSPPALDSWSQLTFKHFFGPNVGDWTDTHIHQDLVKTGWYQQLVLLETVPAKGKRRLLVSELQMSPVVMFGHSFWTGAGIFQQSVPDSRPNNFYSFLMFS